MLKFGLLAGALMLCAMPASAQNAIPDFSGFWQRVDSFQGGRSFDLPESGPGPLIDPRPVTDDGYWVGDHTNPILKPHAAAIVKKRSDFVLGGGIDLPPWSLCWPSGVPQALNLGEPVQFLQTQGQITILYQRDMQVRRVDLGKPHPQNIRPSWYGHSVGNYEGGNTLVVDTVGQNAKASVDRYGTPRSEKIRVVERYTLAPDGRTMTVALTVTDPDTFTMPWSARVTYRRVAAEGGSNRIAERICSENNKDASTGKDYPVPMAVKADF